MRWITLFLALSWISQGATLHLRNGTQMEGILTNQEFTVHTPYGAVSLSVSNLARIRYNSESSTDVAITIFGNRLTGYIHDLIGVRGGVGSLREFNKMDIEEIQLSETHVPAPGRFIVLTSGDLLSGQFALSPIATLGPTGRQSLPMDKVNAIWFVKNEPSIQLELNDGTQTSSVFTNSVLHLALDLGGSVDIPRQLLKVVYVRLGAVPPEVHRLSEVVGPQIPIKANDKAPVRMSWIPAGKFMMGSPLDERGRNSDEGPLTEVVISRGFWMAQYETTQGEYAAIMGQNPSSFQGNTNRPVERVSWLEANEFCHRLTEQAQARGTLPEGHVYRLPTEAEWEYACRAGTLTRYNFGNDPDERQLRDFAWYSGNSGWATHPVGQLKPNAWGLYDIQGNVMEWCLGIWNDAYPGGQVTDYKGPPEGWLRAARGGSWLYDAPFARCANRDDYGAGTRCSDVGFRIVLGPEF